MLTSAQYPDDRQKRVLQEPSGANHSAWDLMTRALHLRRVGVRTESRGSVPSFMVVHGLVAFESPQQVCYL
jgi:hypothetical protein